MSEQNSNQSLGWEEAITRVLRESDGAMHYTDIAEQIATRGYRKVGANPNASVAVFFSQTLENPSSPFQRVGPGQYALKKSLQERQESAALQSAKSVDDSQSGALRAFGMYWQRDKVNWEPSIPKLLGLQSVGASEVNFAKQIGVYLLHDRDRVIYVGRAADKLVVRLRAHTFDRMGGRWDRFSWFGLLGVKEDGSLAEEKIPWSQEVVIKTFEALLIESLEPPLNRRQGDGFSAVEYLQKTDPEIEKIQKQKLLSEMLKTARE